MRTSVPPADKCCLIICAKKPPTTSLSTEQPFGAFRLISESNLSRPMLPMRPRRAHIRSTSRMGLFVSKSSGEPTSLRILRETPRSRQHTAVLKNRSASVRLVSSVDVADTSPSNAYGNAENRDSKLNQINDARAKDSLKMYWRKQVVKSEPLIAKQIINPTMAFGTIVVALAKRLCRQRCIGSAHDCKSNKTPPASSNACNRCIRWSTGWVATLIQHPRHNEFSPIKYSLAL